VPALRIEGYVIVSADGMLANADRVMPEELKFEGDKRFFTAALDRADLADRPCFVQQWLQQSQVVQRPSQMQLI
jgi:hypothetical protein